MKWEGNRESDNVEDRRSAGGGRPVFGGRSIGIGTIVIALLGGWAFGINPLTILGVLSGGEPAQVQQAPAQRPPADDQMARFVSTVLADTEDVWTGVFSQGGGRYQEPKLVLFRGATPTACGTGQAAMGPFYCPSDRKVYIDQLSVRLELQADCFAGVWANHAQSARQILENGDIEAAMNAAARIGDDALQKQSQGSVVPESFTHGTSAQRVRWFNNGLQNGSVKACDTFSTRSL